MKLWTKTELALDPAECRYVELCDIYPRDNVLQFITDNYLPLLMPFLFQIRN